MDILKNINVSILFDYCKEYVKKIFRPNSLVNCSIFVYFVWILAHFIASNLYAYHCTHFSLYGLFVSPLVSVTPYCRGILWTITKGSDTITTMWILIGTTVSALVLKYIPLINNINEKNDKND